MIILPIILLAQLQQVNGGSAFDELGRDVDDRTDTYQQGSDTIGFNEQKTMDESGRQNGNSDNNDDDNDD